ncbi:MAG: RNA 2',3'-cyclic phosphodiesterase [Capsulimonadaceae bacterium]|nr:RNA 2',3'-cyclic phosphodiesterase [Capsulimonadaceae bacterium]
MNTFFAIELNQDARISVAAASRDWAAAAGRRPDLRWAAPEDYHVTLKFLGDQELGSLGPLIQAATAIAGKTRPFPVSSAPAGAFPALSSPVVLWAGVGNSPNLSTLSRRLDRQAALAGIRPDGRRYEPHITLARLKGAPVPAPPNGPHFSPFVVNRFVLMQTIPRGSVRSETNSRYTIVQTFPFCKAAPAARVKRED